MQHWTEIRPLLAEIREIATKRGLTDVLDVVTTRGCPDAGTDPRNRHIGCPTCHGTGRILRDWSELPDGALGGAIDTAVRGIKFRDAYLSALCYGYSDLQRTQSLVAALKAVSG